MNQDASHSQSGACPVPTDELLRQGIAAARAGQREQARDLLMRVVERDEENIAAWLWLSGVVDGLDDQEVCLENVLTLDPENELAQNGLAMLNKKQAKRLRLEGVAAAKAGDRALARDLLTRAVDRDEQDVTAWLWLSGVVDDLEEREICLENALTLDPTNAAARHGLDILRKQREADNPPSATVFTPTDPIRESPLMARSRKPPTLATAIFQEEFARLQEVEELEELELETIAPPTKDEFSDEYLCPYCVHSTQSKDDKCSACGHRLWVRFRQEEKPSTLYWMFLPLQFFAAFLLALIPFIALLIIGFREADILSQAQSMDIFRIIRIALNLPSVGEIVQVALDAVPAIVLILLLSPSLFSYVVFIGIYLRRPKVYRLLLADEALSVIVAAGMWLWLRTTALSVTIALFALIRFVITLRLVDDLRWAKSRILFQVDRGLSNAADFIARADHYTQRKMWALAMLHLRRAAALSAQDPEVHIALATAYLRLRKFERAEGALKEAQRIEPDHPKLARLQALIEELRAAEVPAAVASKPGQAT